MAEWDHGSISERDPLAGICREQDLWPLPDVRRANRLHLLTLMPLVKRVRVSDVNAWIRALAGQNSQAGRTTGFLYGGVFTDVLFLGMQPRKQPVFVDLDETLIFADETSPKAGRDPKDVISVPGYHVWVRPEALEILRICREGGRQVYLFTCATFGYATSISMACGLGFDESKVFSLAMILNCRRGLCPTGALIDNSPHDSEATQQKIDALGISRKQLWVVPSYAPPSFPSAKLFLLGLPLRLEKLDRCR